MDVDPVQNSPGLATNLWDALFETGASLTIRRFQKAWLALLFIIGIGWYATLFENGAFATNFEDWQVVAGPRLFSLQDAVRTWQLPLHISNSETLHGSTTRFLMVPDTLFTPQLILLRWMNVSMFFLIHILLLYSLGFAGLLFLGRRFRLAPISFALLFFLFNFNGHILAHLAAGHDSWGGYLLFPWFAVLVFQLLDGNFSWAWTLKMASLLLVIWLQGSYHQYLYLLMMLALIGLFHLRTFWTVVRTGIFTLSLCALRIIPAALIDASFTGPYLNGFQTTYSLWEGLAVAMPPEEAHFVARGLGRYLGTHELTFYIGIAGTLLVVWFGLYNGLLAPSAPFRKLSLPLLILSFLSMAKIFEGLRAIPIPMIQGERVPLRIFAVVLLFLFIIAAERFQRRLEAERSRRAAMRAAALLSLALIVVDLWQYLNMWRISNAAAQYAIRPFDPAMWFIANDYSDTLYLNMIATGLAVSLLTLGLLIFLVWRERQGKPVTLVWPFPGRRAAK